VFTQSQPGWQSLPEEQEDPAQYPTGSAQTQIPLFPQSESRTQPPYLQVQFAKQTIGP
jgi:hypothetical protein